MSTADTDPPRELALLGRSLELLLEAGSLDEIKDLRDKAEALRLYLRQRDEGLDVQNAAAEIKLRAERRAGKLLIDLGISKGRPEKMSDDSTFSTPTLGELGVTRDQSSQWKRIANLDDEAFDAYVEKTKSADKELTTAGALKIAAQQAIKSIPPQDWSDECGGDSASTLQALIDAGRKFTTIYADPPWRYGNQATRASTDNHYGTMTVEQICAEPVAGLAEENAHLHLWTTNAFLFDAKAVMEAWGFTYKSCFVWVKPQMGIGNYWRVSHEFLLFGVRGTLPFRAKDEWSWAEVERGQHSEKPGVFRQKVERVSPGPYLEMYGRIALPGTAWTVYGNQIRPGSRPMFQREGATAPVETELHVVA